jgi:hypothetical protein
MILHNGETIYLSFTSSGNLSQAPRAWVTEAVVIDGENQIIREVEHGRVRVLLAFEGAHQCEAAAWARCSTELAAFASAIRAKADECATKAAKLSITREEPVS